jgi:hypothetical protein
MLMDGKPLRWLGIDMRTRWRRRVVVVLTYAVFFVVRAWLDLWQGYGWLTPVKGMFALVLAIEFLSVFRDGLILKSFEEVRRHGSYKNQPGAKFGMRIGKKMLTSRLKSSLRFQLMSSTAQEEELKRVEQRVEQSFPYEIREDDPDGLDERERAERNHASRGMVRFLTTMLICGAIDAAMNGRSWKASDVVNFLLGLLVIVRTGPKALVLWREPDPRELSGELGLVEREA